MTTIKTDVQRVLTKLNLDKRPLYEFQDDCQTGDVESVQLQFQPRVVVTGLALILKKWLPGTTVVVDDQNLMTVSRTITTDPPPGLSFQEINPNYLDATLP